MDKIDKIKRWENAAEKLVNILTPKFSENFDRAVVNVYHSTYGLQVQVTFLMKEPFKKEDSDYLHTLRDNVRNYIELHLPKMVGKYHIGFNTETIDSYLNTSKPYYDMKKIEI